MQLSVAQFSRKKLKCATQSKTLVYQDFQPLVFGLCQYESCEWTYLFELQGLIEYADEEPVSGVGEVGLDALDGVFEVFQNFNWRQSKQKQMPNDGVTELSQQEAESVRDSCIVIGRTCVDIETTANHKLCKI